MMALSGASALKPNRCSRAMQALNRNCLGLYPVIALAILWELVARYSDISAVLLPTFSSTVVKLAEMLWAGSLLGDLGTTAVRAAAGLGVALFSGTVVGLLMARIKSLHWFFEPVIAVGLPTPTIMLLPAFLIWFGIGDGSKIMLTAITCFFPVAVSAYSGATSVDEKLLWSAQSQGSSSRQLLWKVIFPASLSYIFAGTRVAVPLAVIITILSEMIAGGGGLGAQLTDSYRFLDSTAEYATLITILVFGYVLDQLLLLALKRFAPWAGEM
ncbi:Putative aliphatic sulfonates transport permease protein SsuC [Castellaniella defragrans]